MTKKTYYNGYTLIELMVWVALFGILASVLVYAFKGPSTECVAGFQYIQQVDGHYHQVIGANGGGVPCH